MNPQEAAQTVKYFGESIGFWIQTGAFLLSAVAAALALFYNARQVRLLRRQTISVDKQAKARATVDVVLHEKGDKVYQEARQRYATIRKAQATLTTLACIDPAQQQDDHSAVLQVLNNYEFMSAGIKSGAFDEDIYRRMKRGLLIRDWGDLQPFVAQLRVTQQRERLFVEFEWLANKWRGEPVEGPVHPTLTRWQQFKANWFD